MQLLIENNRLFHLPHLGGEENNGVLGLAEKNPVEEGADRTSKKEAQSGGLLARKYILASEFMR